MNRAQAVNAECINWYVPVPRGVEYPLAAGLAAAERILRAAKKSGHVTQCVARPYVPPPPPSRPPRNIGPCGRPESPGADRCESALRQYGAAGATRGQLISATGLSPTRVSNWLFVRSNSKHVTIIGRAPICNRHVSYVYALTECLPAAGRAQIHGAHALEAA